MATIGCQASATKKKIQIEPSKIWCWAWVCVCVGLRLRASFAWSLYSLCVCVCVCRTNMPLLSLMKGQPGESTLRGPRPFSAYEMRINLPHALPHTYFPFFSFFLGFFHCAAAAAAAAACDSSINIFQAICNSKLSTRTRNWPTKRLSLSWLSRSPPCPRLLPRFWGQSKWHIHLGILHKYIQQIMAKRKDNIIWISPALAHALSSCSCPPATTGLLLHWIGSRFLFARKPRAYFLIMYK